MDGKPGPNYWINHSDYDINAEFTVTERAGFHKYTFPESKNAHVIMDLTSGIYNYDGKVVWASVRVENDTLITGYRQTNGWARTRFIYFAIILSKPFTSYGLINEEQLVYKGFWRKFNENENFPERAGHKVKGYFNFETSANEPILLKIGLSGVSTRNALENVQKEIPGWNFEQVRRQAKEKWNRELSKIEITANDEKKINFYTSLYHAFLSPVVFSDVNGEYRGLDQNNHRTNGFTNYTIFSLWDTYRALHPLFTIVQQKRTDDIIRSMLAHYEQSVHKILPVWSHYANENWCMIGYHAVPVIADAWMKGIRNYNTEKALKAMVSSAEYDTYDGIGYYKKYGYVPEDLNSNSASKTLEYAYDDWTIYKMAEQMGKADITSEFQKRAEYFRNIFNKETGFMQARNSDGSWKTPFDPMSVAGQGYIEGNAWNYSLYVPQDIKGFIDLTGGNGKLIDWLDNLFVMEIDDAHIAESEDVTRVGMIGNYVHGNEPSHHVPYMYVYAGQPWKTQERIHQIVDSMYRNAPDGLCGNDDCGQMSAWYIFSNLGFYPVTPGSNEYVIGSPCVEHAIINLENGKRFELVANNLTEKNMYIQSVTLNGKQYDKPFITHQSIMDGGILVFEMGAEPNKTWGIDNDSLPYSMTK